MVDIFVDGLRVRPPAKSGNARKANQRRRSRKRAR